MFGGLANLLQPSTIGPPPKDVPPPTSVRFPDYTPQYPREASRQQSLVRFLQSLYRPVELSEAHFEALGVLLHSNASAEDIVPDPSFLPPDSEEWLNLTPDQARTKDADFRIPLSNGNLSPEARAYLDRRNELSTDNQAAFRTVRRIRPEPGVKTPRLGNCYEFYRQLEQMASYWDDSSLPPLQQDNNSQSKELEDKKNVTEPLPNSQDESPEQAHLAQVGTATSSAESHSRAESKEPQDKSLWRVTYRTASGNIMPAEIRHHVISSFIKLVSYDFGCNIAAPRVEPRLHLLEPPPAPSHHHENPPREPVASYFPSGCVFMVRTPTTREAARSGVVEGPIAAVSARNTTNFSNPTENTIDFGRELIAALITAQHRARENKEEKRFGDGKWWATVKRWGGGEGGPIGREIESTVGAVDNKSPTVTESPTTTSAEGGDSQADTPESSNSKPADQAKVERSSRQKSPPHPISPASGLPMRGPPAAKKQRKGGHLSIYDNYRQVRLPSPHWDKKARYTAIGKIPGAEYDDVFVISGLFHHISILRVRVPMKLLDVLAGAAEDQVSGGEGHKGGAEGTGGLSWGKLEIWRSKWFDLFLVQDRLEALRLLWGINAWAMRKVETAADAQKDAHMKGA